MREPDYFDGATALAACSIAPTGALHSAVYRSSYGLYGRLIWARRVMPQLQELRRHFDAAVVEPKRATLTKDEH